MDETFGEKLMRDKRVAEAKRLLAEVFLDYSPKIKEVRGSEPDLSPSYEEMLKKFADLRGRELFIPYLSSGLGNGALVELADGTVKYDFITGIGVHYMGHSNLKMVGVCIDAAIQDTVMQGNLQQDIKSLELSETLVSAAQKNGAQLKHCFLTSSGAMANENALKVIFQKHEPANRIIAFNRCFAGRSLATAQITNKPENRVGQPKVLEVDYIPFFDHEDPEGSTADSLDALQKCLARNKGGYAGMVFELVQGEGGYYAGTKEFFRTLMEELKKNNVAVFVDEVQTFGRTEELYAFQYFELDDLVDVVSVGKMLQACATLYTADYNPKPGLLSQTFTASTSAIHAGCAILDEVLNNGYLGKDGKIAKSSQYFRAGLEKLAEKFPRYVAGPFGCGAMVGMTVFDGSPEKAKEFLNVLYHNGVMGFVAGKDPTRVRFLMPVGAVKLEDIDNVCLIVEKTIEDLTRA